MDRASGADLRQRRVDDQKDLREIGLRLAGALWQFWQGHGYLGEGREWLEGLLALEERGDLALSGFGDIARQHGDMARAIALYAESLTLNRTVGHLLGVAESEERLARIAHDRGQPERAVWLLGAADTLRTTIGAPLPRADRATDDRILTVARAALGDEGFTAAWAAGAALTPEQAIAEAVDGMTATTHPDATVTRA